MNRIRFLPSVERFASSNCSPKPLGEPLEQVADLLFLEDAEALDEIDESQAPDLDVGRGQNLSHPGHHLRCQDPGQVRDTGGRDHVE